MSMRLTGINFDTTIGDSLVHVDKASLNITDETGVAKTRGVPDGETPGGVDADGEIELAAHHRTSIVAEARRAGSFREMPTLDLVFYARTFSDEMKVEAFGCRLMISSLMELDGNGEEEAKIKLPFKVTSPDFVRLDGVPYLAAFETERL